MRSFMGGSEVSAFGRYASECRRDRNFWYELRPGQIVDFVLKDERVGRLVEEVLLRNRL